MRTRNWLFGLCLLAGVVGFADRPRAAGPTAKFHVIGDVDTPAIADGAMTIIRDATRVGSGVYAVGGAVTRQLCAAVPFASPCPNPDTPILWTFDGTNTPTLEALPDFDFVTEPTQLFGSPDLTPDGLYIASQARVSNAPAAGFLPRAVRVNTTSPIVSPGLNLNTTFSPALPYPTNATAISSDGTIVYGFGSPAGTPVRALRFDTTGATSLVIPLLCPAVSLPECPAAHTTNFVTSRSTSSNGNVAIGASFVGAVPAAPGVPGVPPGPRKAFRYVHGSGVTAIPLLPGGTFNDVVALSSDGDLVLLIGNGTGAPNGEPYLHRASTDTIQRLGSPNPDLLHAWGPGGRVCVNDTGNCSPPRLTPGGMSADGSVVAMNVSGGTVTSGQYAYFHNPHGWFHLSSALFAHGIDLGIDGWNPQTLLITGVSPDGTLVFGTGAQNGVIKGFVAEFPVGALVSFNPTPSPPSDPSIVGAWTQGGPETVVFTADGAYYHIGHMQSGGFQSTGFEHGYYTYDGEFITITTMFDNNGKEGLSDGNGSKFPVAIVENTLTFVDDPEDSQLQRVVGGPGSIVGGWVGGNPTEAHNSLAIVVTDSLVLNVFDFSDGYDAGVGTYTYSPVTHELVFTPLGGGVPDSGNFVTVSADERVVHVVGDDGEEFDAIRVIDPRTPLITSALDAAATTGLAFQYQIT